MRLGSQSAEQFAGITLIYENVNREKCGAIRRYHINL